MKFKLLAVIIGLCLIASTAYATPQEALIDTVLNSGVFPMGTTIVNVACDGVNLAVDLSPDAVGLGFDDTKSDAYTDALRAAVAEWPEIESIDITVGGVQVSQYLPPNSNPTYEEAVAPMARMSTLSAQTGTGVPEVPALTDELAGKLLVLGPSHGAFAKEAGAGWYRAMRTFCGPSPATNPLPNAYQPSDYYYWTRGFQWPQYYEDDMSPELIRFLYAYCKSSGGDAYVNRNLDKNAGLFPWSEYGYGNPGFTLPKWMTACKYALEDRGGIPASVWNTTDVTGQSNIDLRARAYYVNWLMETKGYTKDNTMYLALHSNAAGAGTARGTETLHSLDNTVWKTEQARTPNLATAINNAIIASIRNEYDGFWANAVYNAQVTPVPPEWPSGTYRGYDHAAASTPSSTAGWQNRGVKKGNYGEIRECKCPAVLNELVFHDDWKFYPDEAFHQDQIFRATVTWGMYEGICNFFSVTPKPRLNAEVASADFPAFVPPNAAISGTIAMKNLGQAWCWGNKQIGTDYVPYTVWCLRAATDDEFGQAGTKIQIADDGVYYPGDTASFAVSLTAPATTGLYTTKWKMVKDDQRGGSFGPVASAQIQVDADAPIITIASPGSVDYPHCGSITVSFSATDALSGVASTTATLDGNTIENGASISLLATSLGAHTLAVTATDNVGNTATSSVTFTVVATIESLIGAVNELYAAGRIDNDGIQNSLLVKLAKYERDSGDSQNAKNYLKNFINEVTAQSGQHMTVATADLLIADANAVIAQLP